MEWNVRMMDKQADWAWYSDWWKQRKDSLPPHPILMPKTTFVVELDGVPASTVSSYIDEEGLTAYHAWIANNPDLASELRTKSLKIGLLYADSYAKERGVKWIFGFTSHDHIKETYKQLDYKVGDPVATSFLKGVK